MYYSKDLFYFMYGIKYLISFCGNPRMYQRLTFGLIEHFLVYLWLIEWNKAVCNTNKLITPFSENINIMEFIYSISKIKLLVEDVVLLGNWKQHQLF